MAKTRFVILQQFRLFVIRLRNYVKLKSLIDVDRRYHLITSVVLQAQPVNPNRDREHGCVTARMRARRRRCVMSRWRRRRRSQPRARTHASSHARVHAREKRKRNEEREERKRAQKKKKQLPMSQWGWAQLSCHGPRPRPAGWARRAESRRRRRRWRRGPRVLGTMNSRRSSSWCRPRSATAWRAWRASSACQRRIGPSPSSGRRQAWGRARRWRCDRPQSPCWSNDPGRCRSPPSAPQRCSSWPALRSSYCSR